MISYRAIKKTKFHILVAFVILAGIVACNPNVVMGEYKSIPQAKWHKDSVVTFQIPISDTLQNHNFYINVRNDINYKYSNLWLFVEIAQANEAKAIIDTFEITLADEHGKWLGTGFGGVKTHESLYRQNVYFPVSGNYNLKITQGMRDSQLKGITEIGYRLEKE